MLLLNPFPSYTVTKISFKVSISAYDRKFIILDVTNIYSVGNITSHRIL